MIENKGGQLKAAINEINGRILGNLDDAENELHYSKQQNYSSFEIE